MTLQFLPKDYFRDSLSKLNWPLVKKHLQYEIEIEDKIGIEAVEKAFAQTLKFQPNSRNEVLKAADGKYLLGQMRYALLLVQKEFGSSFHTNIAAAASKVSLPEEKNGKISASQAVSLGSFINGERSRIVLRKEEPIGPSRLWRFYLGCMNLLVCCPNEADFLIKTSQRSGNFVQRVRRLYSKTLSSHFKKWLKIDVPDVQFELPSIHFERVGVEMLIRQRLIIENIQWRYTEAMKKNEEFNFEKAFFDSFNWCARFDLSNKSLHYYHSQLPY